MRASKNTILGLGAGLNPGPLAPKACAPLHNYYNTMLTINFNVESLKKLFI